MVNWAGPGHQEPPTDRTATPAAHDPAAFVRRTTVLGHAPLVPEIRLHLADDAIAVWELTEAALGRSGVDPPFWAFAWAGGQALARHVLDHPDLVAGRRVLDLAAGGGLVAVAAARAGAAEVIANDVDVHAVAAVQLNAAANGVTVDTTSADLLADPEGGPDVDVVLAGDVCYERPMTSRVLPWLRHRAAGGALVLLGDPGRAYLPRDELVAVATYDVPVPPSLEGVDHKPTGVWRLRGMTGR